MPPEPDPVTGSRPPDPSRPLTRGERHHLEIVLLALRGELARASALAREHLRDHPDDVVVARLLASLEAPLPDGR